MDKPADSKFPIHELIRDRWSPRAFEDRPVEREKLQILLEAARWAPSSYNEQPWSYIVATKENRAEYDQLLGCLIPANQLWAKGAPVLMISVARLTFERNGKENRHGIHDVGLASENLVLQAQALGLSAHQMAGFSVEAAIKTFEIPEGYVPVAAIAVGYPGDPARLPSELRDRELEARARKPVSSFVFSGKWGNSAPLAPP